MISNKIISIVKENQFNKGWTIFSPTSFDVERNEAFKRTKLSDVVKLITFSNKVNLILSQPCLPSKIVEELEWVNKYIKINLIAKRKEIVDRYKNLSFNSCKIDDKASIDYIGITGKNDGYYMIGDDLCEVDDSIEKFYFNKFKNRDRTSFLSNVKSIVICERNKHKGFDDLLSLFDKKGIKLRYVISVESYDKTIYDYAKTNNIELFVSDYVEEAILVINKDNSICRMSIIDEICIALFPIDRISKYVGKLYKCLFLNGTIEADKIPDGVYSCFEGEINEFIIKNRVVIKKEINISEMFDFVSETFDKSIVDDHNQYSNKARETQYLFTLIPPIIDSSYKESSIYEPIHRLLSEWEDINNIRFDRIIQDYKAFMNKDIKLIDFIAFSQSFSKKLKRMIIECSYHGYHSTIEDSINNFMEYRKNLIDDCSLMFDEVNSERTDSRFNKFDDEIEGYRRTIKEKEALISAGKDVLSNNRRIEILNKKIEDLLALKEKFENSSSSRTSKEKESFVVRCRDLINVIPASSDNEDSIGKIIAMNDSSKLVRLNHFVSNYLRQINEYLNNSITCLKKMIEVNIPEEYPVFEKDGQKYIVLNDLSEYDSTKELCDEYSLKCLARR